MQVIFKDFKKDKIPLEIEPTDTIISAKERLAATKECETSQLKFVYSGKVLPDDKTFEAYKVKENDQIIFMISKAKKPIVAEAPVASAVAAEEPAPVAEAQPETPAEPVAAASTAASTAATAGAVDLTASSFVTGEEREAAIRGMIDMGYERSQVERALAAAFNNPLRAVEYLLFGNPATEDADVEVEAAAEETQEPDREERQQSVNLFEAAAAAEGSRGGSEGVSDADRIRHLQEIIQTQPEMLESILQQIASSNPQLAQVIQENPEHFARMLLENAGDDEAFAEGAQLEGEGEEGLVQIQITQDENAAIDRLCELGFDRNLVIQVYFACDKNEEMAANLLLSEHMDG
ncbi:unnamed protein product [Kuraishia capsulata CBS 1993]|uniref:UV excision repair protein RAD23 n=1 Tax=Kuraishia capsulata CBS 1993 TaxID=1382522 RepID=W6MT84_9ASCO|nr:uncharacterized protein KUCA_T00006021001 [Kuraishia capsulata CBS 1993]CDK30026.1 unnamed protein product [Kuraishia capsulata CBS 1993]